MLLEALIYLLDYKSIIQINVHLTELSVEINYSVDMLFHFLDKGLNLNICKSWVNYLDDKRLLQPYLVKYSHDIEWINLLLTFYPEIDHRHNNDMLLISCCKYDHQDMIKWLINNGANIRTNDYQPFIFACQCGHLRTAEYLLGLIDNVNEKKLCIQAQYDRALRCSALKGHLDIIKWLIDNGANIRVNNYKPFQFACQHGHMKTAEYLLSLIDTDDEEKKLCVQSDDNYALIWSAKNGHLEVVKWLVNNEANVEVNDYQPFRFACEYGHLETAQYLLGLIDDTEEKKLCVQSDDDYALIWSADNGHLEVVKWLVSNGADIRVGDYEGFGYACESGHLSIAKYLLSLIDDVEERKRCVQSDDNYALTHSARNDHLEVAKWLVSNGAAVRDYPFNQLSEEERINIQ